MGLANPVWFLNAFPTLWEVPAPFLASAPLHSGSHMAVSALPHTPLLSRVPPTKQLMPLLNLTEESRMSYTSRYMAFLHHPALKASWPSWKPTLPTTWGPLWNLTHSPAAKAPLECRSSALLGCLLQSLWEFWWIHFLSILLGYKPWKHAETLRVSRVALTKPL